MTDGPGRVVGAAEIARAIGLPPPTDQQRAVVEAPLAPALVTAGAGSGKTETMAARVLWLLANGHVEPGRILGLTFTRKAAGELAARLADRILALDRAGLLPAPFDAFDPPVVTTYNAFAQTLYRDNALLLGRDGDGAVLGEAAAWQLARAVVVGSGDDRLAHLDKGVDAVVQAVLDLNHALRENLGDAQEVAAMAAEFARLGALPPGGRGTYPTVDDAVRAVGALPALLDLATAFDREKARHGFVEYSDQVALALEVVHRVARVAVEVRDRHRVVLLDEYQDTSVAQTRMLAALFGPLPVMAVGDPHQSIYGWRGASASSLGQFRRWFGPERVRDFSLTISWRNGSGILAAANALVAPLAADSPVAVARLEPGPAASAEPVDTAFEETLEEEADAAARWLADRPATATGEPPSSAILFRTRAAQPAFVDALRRHGVPYHVLGLSGLLAEPEVADVVAALAVVADPEAGPELVRLLAGSRWRLGVRDLHALAAVASWLRDRDAAGLPLEHEARRRLRSSVAPGEGGSIVEALDFVAHARAGHPQLSGFSEAGLERVRAAGRLFAELRARAGLDLAGLVQLVIERLMLDVELEANESRPRGNAALDALLDAVADYLAVSETGGLAGFLGWLRQADARESLAPRGEEPEPGTVQLLTIHGAKGLEWDHVVVPRWVRGGLPARAKEGKNGWLRFGVLPYEFRGDAGDLPVLPWREATSRKAFVDDVEEFRDRVGRRHDDEERRLAYVAVTRARHGLLLTGSFWDTTVTPRTPSAFLGDLVEAGVVPAPPGSSAHDANPNDGDGERLRWPPDPLGGRREAVSRAAERVRSASADVGPWREDLDRLLAERRESTAAASAVAAPARIPASRFQDYVADPERVAAELRRPMPERPHRATRLGTLFHSWVEERYGVGGTAEAIDAFAGETDADLDGDGGADAGRDDRRRLAELQRTFESSPWAAMRPVEVEREIHLPFAGRTVVCKIDAVYRRPGGFQIVDWKTGRAPRSAAELEHRRLQLALYRLAYARWAGVDPERVDACFYFVAEDRVVEPKSLEDEAGLLALWRRALG